MLYLLRCCCCWRDCCFFWKTDGTNDFFLVNVLPLPVKLSVGVSGFLCCWRLGDVEAPSNCCFGCWWWWCRPLEFEEVGVVTVPVPVPPWDTANDYIQLFICILWIFLLLTSLALLITFTKTFGTQTIKLVITIIATSLSAFQILLRHTQLHLVWHVVVLSLSLLGEYFFL